MCKYVSFSCKEFTVQTDDGYKLKLFRVKKSDFNETANPVFLQHGLFGRSTNWAARGDSSLLHVLVEQGFDVWVGNNRGNVYGRGHDSLDPVDNAEEFFDYSFYENGRYDMKSQIERALSEANKTQISFVGHS